MSKRAEQIALMVYPVHSILFGACLMDTNKSERQAFLHGYEQAEAHFLEILDRWQKHSVRGMKEGATAFHQGKIALITELKDWINETE